MSSLIGGSLASSARHQSVSMLTSTCDHLSAAIAQVTGVLPAATHRPGCARLSGWVTHHGTASVAFVVILSFLYSPKQAVPLCCTGDDAAARRATHRTGDCRQGCAGEDRRGGMLVCVKSYWMTAEHHVKAEDIGVIGGY